MPHATTAYAVVGDDAVLALTQVQLRDLQPEDAELQVICCGVCHSDVHQVKSEWKSIKKNRPLVPGHEIVARVVRAGPKSVVKPGQRVGVGTLVGCCLQCQACKQGEESYCTKAVDTYNGVHAATGMRCHGGFAERMVVDSRFCFPIPDALPSETAAPMLCAGITVYSPLRRWCTPQSAVAIVGIGGLGHLALQFARALDINVVCAVTTSKDKDAAARSFGATDVLVSSSKEEMNKHAFMYDFVLVTVSSDLPWASYLRLLKTGGRLCLVGLPPSGEMKLNPFALTGRRLSVCGSNTGGLQETKDMLELAAKKRVRTATERLPLYACLPSNHNPLTHSPAICRSAEGANEAVRRVDKNLPRFRCVMVASGEAAQL
jgi:D-arabinose 1-dehydrogenase-like Zn-dependent alcohol dehydrogenase